MRVRSVTTSLSGFGVVRQGTSTTEPDFPVPVPVPRPTTPIPSPAPPPPTPPSAPPPPSGGVIPKTIEQIIEENREKLRACILVIELAAGAFPMPATSGSRWLSDVLSWSQRLNAARSSSPLVNEAIAFIQLVFPREKESDSFFSAIGRVGKAVVNGVVDAGGFLVRGVATVGHAIGSAIEFIAGDLPSPDDYEPENLCVTAWTDPPKFAVLTAAAAIVFPPALLYIASYVPPSPVGFTAGLIQAYAKGGGQRVITKILEPMGEYLSEILTTAIDFAFRGDAALIRWALRKIASRLQEGIPQAVIYALSEASDVVVGVIKDVSRLKGEGFYVDVGNALQKIADRFPKFREALRLAGEAIRSGARAIGILVDKKTAGIQEALGVFLNGILGIPTDFGSLSERAQIEIAKAKASAIAMAGALAQNLKQGIADLTSAADKIPGGLKDLARSILGLVGKFSEEVNAFIDRLVVLAQTPDPTETPPPAPPPAPTPQTPLPTPTGGGSSKLLAIGAGGLMGALVGGPIGAVIGAGASAVLAKD